LAVLPTRLFAAETVPVMGAVPLAQVTAPLLALHDELVTT
jgi:hypothetical protein